MRGFPQPHFIAAPCLCAGLVLVVIGVLLAGCDRTPADKRVPTGAVVAVIGAVEDHPQWPGMRGGAERYLSGITSLRAYCIAPLEENAESVRAAVRRALEARPAVVCLQIARQSQVEAALTLLLEAQVLLVTFGEEFYHPRVSAHVGIAWGAGAELLGANLARIAAGRPSYVLVHDAGRDELGKECYERFSAAARHQFGVTLLEARGVSDGEAAVARAAEELLERYRNTGLLVTLARETWLRPRAGWRAALREHNADFRFAALSAAPTLWPRLGTAAEPGEAAALAGPLDGEIGYAAAAAAAALVLGNEPPRDQTIRCELVTPETLPDFQRRYEAAAGNDPRIHTSGATTVPRAAPPRTP